MTIPMRIKPDKPVRVVRLPYKLKVMMPDGARGVVRGDSFTDSLDRAGRIGVKYAIDRANHKWLHDGNMNFSSVAVIKRVVVAPSSVK